MSDSHPDEPNSFRNRLLRNEVSWKTFYGFLLSVLMAICGLVFINAVQVYVIIDILSYPRENLGFATGSLAFADELLCVPMVTLWGFISDRYGRQIIMAIGLAIMALSISLYPWASCVFPSNFANIFSSLLFFRLLFAVGGSASTSMITALIGDIALEGGRSKVAGFVGIAAGFGALSAALLFARLPLLFSRNVMKLSLRLDQILS